VNANGPAPAVILGYVSDPGGGSAPAIIQMGPVGNAGLYLAFDFSGESAFGQASGWYRWPNIKMFNQYLDGNMYGPTFFAPKDRVVLDYFDPCLDEPGDICYNFLVQEEGAILKAVSYSLSPAALFAPEVMKHEIEQGLESWQNPAQYGAGFRVPRMSEARYPHLKTHMAENHWLQGPPSDCNPNPPSNQGANFSYNGCTPYFFNHGLESRPAVVFYDGHVGQVGTKSAFEQDNQLQATTSNADGGSYGLWMRNTPLGSSGFFCQLPYTYSNPGNPTTGFRTSFHILTTDGIRGRDILSAD
jgi:hypothetical protein